MGKLCTKSGIVWWVCIGVFVELAVGGVTVGVIGYLNHCFLLSAMGFGLCVVAVIFGLTTHNFGL